jgi:SAM-dependent methyltransferase
MTVFSDYAKYYNLLYRDKDYASETSYILSLLRQFQCGEGAILEFGSGTGRHAALLAEEGYSVCGVELSQEMLQQAQRLAGNNPRLEFLQGDMREVRLEQRADAVISLFHVMSYQTSNSSLDECFRTFREHLKPRGLLIFDCWYGPCVLTERPATGVKRVFDDSTEVTRLVEPQLHPNENTVDVNYHIFVRDLPTGTVSEIRETHRMRYFFLPEIEMLLELHGFTLLRAEQWLTGRGLGCDTFGACFVAQLD